MRKINKKDNEIALLIEEFIKQQIGNDNIDLTNEIKNI